MRSKQKTLQQNGRAERDVGLTTDAPDGPGWIRMSTETNAAKPEGRKKVGGLGARKTCLNRGMTIVISLPCL